MVVDTSAIVAILRSEPDSDRIVEALREATGPIMSAATRLELSIVAGASSTDPHAGASAAIAVLDAADVVTVPVDEMLADIGFEAWTRFGKGNHRARLNFGDVFSYALAVHLDVPVLCVGDDFRQTDIDVVELGRAAD